MESISIFEIIKIGIGPSSSHTMGPWRAAELFLSYLHKNDELSKVTEIYTYLYGSLAKTGLGHGSDIAIMLGLSNEDFTTIDTDKINDKIERIRQRGLINISEDQAISFNYEKHIIFEFNKKLDYHPNGMRFEAILSDGNTISREYFSVGGGFVVTQDSNFVGQNPIITQFPCHTAQDIMKNCKKTKS